MTNEERRKATEWFRNRAKNCPMSGARRMYEIATEALEERERNELPPHGRLIDADALSSKLTDLAECEWNQSTGTTWAEAFEEVDGFVQDAPTIIEAEWRET